MVKTPILCYTYWKLKVITTILVMRQHFPQELLKPLDMDYRPSLTWFQKFGTFSERDETIYYSE